MSLSSDTGEPKAFNKDDNTPADAELIQRASQEEVVDPLTILVAAQSQGAARTVVVPFVGEGDFFEGVVQSKADNFIVCIVGHRDVVPIQIGDLKIAGHAPVFGRSKSEVHGQ